MAAETYGTKGQPQFASTGAPAIDVDPGQVADYAALVGNHIVGTTAQRTANVVPGASAKPVWTGLTWEDTDDGFTYKRVGSAWVRTLDDTGWIVVGSGGTAPAFQNGWVNFGGAYKGCRFRRLNGVVYVQGEIKSGTASGANPIFFLPTGFRPDGFIIVGVVGNGGATNMEIGPDGRIVPGDVALTPLRQSITLTPFPADQ